MQLPFRLPGQRIEQRQGFNVIVKQGNADRVLGVFRRKNINHIATHTINAAPEINLIALILHFRQALNDLALRHFFALAQMQDHAVVIPRVTNAVDRRHGTHNDHIAPLQQTLGGR